MDIINYDFIAAALVAFLLNPLLVTTTMVVLQSLCSCVATAIMLVIH